MEVPAIDPELAMKTGDEIVHIDDLNVGRYAILEQAVGLDTVFFVVWPHFDVLGPGAADRDKSDFFATLGVQPLKFNQPANHHKGLMPLLEVVAPQHDDDQVDLIVNGPVLLLIHGDSTSDAPAPRAPIGHVLHRTMLCEAQRVHGRAPWESNDRHFKAMLQALLQDSSCAYSDGRIGTTVPWCHSPIQESPKKATRNAAAMARFSAPKARTPLFDNCQSYTYTAIRQKSAAYTPL